MPNHLLRRGGGRTPAARGPQPQNSKVRHTPRRSVPRYVSPFVRACHPVQSGQVGAGWSAQQRAPGISLPSPGVRRTFHHPVGSDVPVEARPGFGSKDILFTSLANHHTLDSFCSRALSHPLTPSAQHTHSVHSAHWPLVCSVFTSVFITHA